MLVAFSETIARSYNGFDRYTYLQNLAIFRGATQSLPTMASSLNARSFGDDVRIDDLLAGLQDIQKVLYAAEVALHTINALVLKCDGEA